MPRDYSICALLISSFTWTLPSFLSCVLDHWQAVQRYIQCLMLLFGAPEQLSFLLVDHSVPREEREAFLQQKYISKEFVAPWPVDGPLGEVSFVFLSFSTAITQLLCYTAIMFLCCFIRSLIVLQSSQLYSSAWCRRVHRKQETNQITYIIYRVQ